MARTVKKEAELTAEEKLARALVPEAEQPYGVPGNWCWVHLLDSFDNHTDSKKKIQKKDYLEEGSLAIVDQGQEIVGGYSDNDEMRYVGTLPVIIFGDHTRCIKYIDFPFAQGADGIKVLSPRDFFIPKCFFYGLQNINIPSMGYRRHYPLFKDYSIPVPPFVEQQRIVNRIESLFAKLDAAKEKAQAVVDGFEDRKAAILHQAFTGELTKDWRKQKSIPFTTWKKLTVRETCLEVKVGIVIKPSQYYTDENSGTATFRSANVREFHIDDSDWVFLNDAGMSANQRSIVHTGDVLIVRSGNPGTACVVEERFDGYNAIDVLIAVPNKEVITSDYLCAFTNSPMGKNLVAENKRGMALAHFNVGGYSKLKLPLPTIEEQKEIVATVFSLMSKEQKAKEAAEQVISQIDIMKKSILARAFRGELGTNNPDDESAEELLKQIL